MSGPAVSNISRCSSAPALIARGRAAQRCPLPRPSLKSADDWLADYRRLLGRAPRSPRRLPQRLAGQARRESRRVHGRRARVPPAPHAARRTMGWRSAQRSTSTSGPLRRSSPCVSSPHRASWCLRFGPTPSTSRNGGVRIGFTTTTAPSTCTVGGVWRFVMHGPDGRDYQNRITFEVRLSRPSASATHHGGCRRPRTRPISHDRDVSRTCGQGRTRLTLHAVFPSRPSADARDQATYRADKGALETAVAPRRSFGQIDPLSVGSCDPPVNSKVETVVALTPYLFFDGRCERGHRVLQKKTLGGQVQMMMRFKDGPDQTMCAPGNEDKVMHACVSIARHAGDAVGRPRADANRKLRGIRAVRSMPRDRPTRSDCSARARPRRRSPNAAGRDVSLPSASAWPPTASVCGWMVIGGSRADRAR